MRRRSSGADLGRALVVLELLRIGAAALVGFLVVASGWLSGS